MFMPSVRRGIVSIDVESDEAEEPERVTTRRESRAQDVVEREPPLAGIFDRLTEVDLGRSRVESSVIV